MRPLRFVAILAGVAIGVSSAPGRAQDGADLVVRLSQLEAQMRQMSGKIEELQFQNQQLREQLKRFQEDTEYRFQEGGKGAGQASTPRAPVAAAPAAPPRQVIAGPPVAAAPTSAPAPITRGPVRGDAYDPQADPAAPGAPRPLGSPDSGAPAPRRAGAPASIMSEPVAPAGGPGTPLDIAGAASQPGVPQAQPRPPQTSIAATGTDSVRADFDNAYTFIQQRQFEQAEMGFRSFLQSHPRSKLIADATYWLGESYLQRARYRDAAEQFLKITTSFGTSAKGADGMFKLGISLRGLGANDQACATFAEVGRKYPTARPALLKDVQREQQRAKCPS
ncbi:MAG: tol-pal system protein YbgF [Hyphomicrobiales bacterium]